MIKNVIILALSIILVSAYFKVQKLENENAKLTLESENTKRFCKITQDNVTHIFKCEIVNLTTVKAEF